MSFPEIIIQSFPRLGNGVVTPYYLGYTPDLVIVKGDNDDYGAIFKTSQMTGDNALSFTETDGFLSDMIEFTETGVEFGIGVEVNNPQTNYYITVIKDPTGTLLQLFNYAGNNTDNSTLTTLYGTAIAGVWEVIKRSDGSSATGAKQRFGTMTGDNTLGFDASGFSSNMIQDITTDTTLGTDASVNASSGTYYGFAIKGLAGYVFQDDLVGNGVNDRQVSDPNFRPALLNLKSVSSTYAGRIRMGKNLYDQSLAFTPSGISENQLQEFNSTGFILGNHDSVNKNGFTYHYIALVETAIFHVPFTTSNITFTVAHINSGFWADYLCDGLDDDVEINAALDAGYDTGGAVELLGTGVQEFNLANPIILRRGSSSLRSTGRGTQLKAQANFPTGRYMIETNPQMQEQLGELTIADLTVNAADIADGIHFSSVGRSSMSNVSVTNAEGNAFRGDNNTGGSTNNCKFINCDFTGSNNGSTVDFPDAEVNTWIGCDFRGARSTASNFQFRPGRNDVVMACNIWGGAYMGMRLIASAQVIGCHFEYLDTNAISIDPASHSHVITGCNFFSSGMAGLGEYSDIIVKGHQCTISHNIFSSTRAKYNIEETLDTNTGGNTYIGNIFIDNHGGNPILLNDSNNGVWGKSIVDNNKGFRSENAGRATVANTTTSIAVQHFLHYTPVIQEISVTPTNNLGNSTKYWISNVTATHFTINVDADPGATTATFVWKIKRTQIISASPSPSASVSPSSSVSKSTSPSSSVSKSPSPSASVSSSSSRSVSPSGSVSPSSSASPSGSVSPSVSHSASVSVSPSVSVSVSPSVSPSGSVSASTSPSVSLSPSPSASTSPSASGSPSASVSPSYALATSTKSLSCDGNNDSALGTTGNADTLVEGKSTLSISFWFKLLSDTGNAQRITGTRTGSGNWTHLFQTGASLSGISWGLKASSDTVQTPSYTFVTDVWYHVVMQYDSAAGSNNTKLYIGKQGTDASPQLVHEYTQTGNTATSTEGIRVGIDHLGTNDAHMNFDELRIFSSALTSQERLDLYNELDMDTNMTAYWPFDEASGNATDTVAGYVLTVTGATRSTDTPFA